MEEGLLWNFYLFPVIGFRPGYKTSCRNSFKRTGAIAFYPGCI